MRISAFAIWFILSGFVGMMIFEPLIVITILLCARFANSAPEERKYRIREEIYIGIGEFVAYLLETTALVLEYYYDVDLFLRPIVRQINGWDDRWGGALLLFASLYLLNRIILKMCIRIIFQRRWVSQLGEAFSIKNLFGQMNKTVRVVLLTVIVLVVAVFSLFRIVTVKSGWGSDGLKNKYPGYILCEVGSGHNLMFSWNYYRLKRKAQEDLQALLEEAKAEKKWISEYEINDRYIYMYVDMDVGISKEEKDKMDRREDPQAVSSEYYAYLGDYGERIMEQFMVMKALTGKTRSGMEDESIYQNIIIIYV